MRVSFGFTFASLLLATACGGGSKPPVANAGGTATIAPGAIRAVDFANRTYDSENGTITVKDGEAEIEIDPEMPEMRGWFNVSAPVYGDVNGDGVEDAIVITAWNGGGSGTFTSGEIYTVRPDSTEPTQIGAIPGGDRGDGGLDDIRIEGGTIHVDRNLALDEDGACCPSKLVKEVWAWNGSAFVEDEAARQTIDNPNFQD